MLNEHRLACVGDLEADRPYCLTAQTFWPTIVAEINVCFQAFARDSGTASFGRVAAAMMQQ